MQEIIKKYANLIENHTCKNFDLEITLEDFAKELKAETAEAVGYDLLVSRKFAEEDIKKRYDMICKQIEFWQKRIEKEWSYEDGYKNGLTYAEKQFRNLFS